MVQCRATVAVRLVTREDQPPGGLQVVKVKVNRDRPQALVARDPPYLSALPVVTLECKNIYITYLWDWFELSH